MRLSSRLKGNPKRSILGVLCCATLALMSGSSVTGSATWQVGDVVVCIGSGTCRIYSTPSTFTTIQVPTNPKQATGGAFWAGSFDAWVVDSKNQEVLLYSKTDPHTILKTIDTSLQLSSGHPGPVVGDSAGSIYVGMYDAPTILKYDSAGNHVATIGTGAGGPPSWMDLADDHKTMWFTTAGSPRHIQRIDVSSASLLGAVEVTGAGTAGGLRLLPLLHPYNGDGGVLLADGLNIKRFGTATAPQTYDATGEDAWRTVTLEPDGAHFLAATAAGKIYRFPLAGGAGVLFADTGSSQISGLTVKGGVQLNIRPLNYTAGTDVQREAVYGNPSADVDQPFPRHSIGVKIASVPTAFTLVTSANWVVTDGTCGPDADDYDCRTTDSFGTDPAPSPRCIPYVSANEAECAFYRYEDEATTLPTGVSSENFLSFIDYHEPGKRTANPYVHPACTGNPVNGNPRMLRDPDPTPGQFESDITVGITRTSATDPIFGSGTGRSGSDYGAFDRCLEDEAGDTVATIDQPTNGSSHRWGRSLPFSVFVVDGLGNDVPDAVTPPHNMSLFIQHEDGLVFLEPQRTPGASPLFFQKQTIKVGKQTRIVYAANLETSQFLDGDGNPLLGNFVGCVTSVTYVDPNLPTPSGPGEPGQFSPVCVGFSLR